MKYKSDRWYELKNFNQGDSYFDLKGVTILHTQNFLLEYNKEFNLYV